MNYMKILEKRITGEYYSGNVSNDDYLAYMSDLIERLSNSGNYQVKTIRDVKKTYKKTAFN